MKESTAARLTNFFDAGYALHIGGTPYTTSFVTSIGKEDYEDDESPYVYSDDTFDNRPLSEVDLSDVKVFKPVHFYDEVIEEVEEPDFMETDQSGEGE